MRDTETLMAMDADGKLTIKVFSPDGGATRLKYFATMYERYRVVSLTFKYIPMAAYTDSTGFSMGWRAGPSNASITTMEKVLKLKPAVGGHSSVTNSIHIVDPMPSKWLNVGESLGCLYVIGPKSGYITVSYHVYFDSPQPF